MGGVWRRFCPWYFRTIEAWCALFDRYGLNLQHVIEPAHPKAGWVASLILIGEYGLALLTLLLLWASFHRLLFLISLVL